ncbi:hypothetical protein F5888DRAFT_1635986 [Russula emetica]|nr:hypothetical protein F5888DRAFT_1635986 [Russula emetica]
MDRIHDPRNAIRTVTSATQAQLDPLNFWHATGGLYIWEYITTLDLRMENYSGPSLLSMVNMDLFPRAFGWFRQHNSLLFHYGRNDSNKLSVVGILSYAFPSLFPSPTKIVIWKLNKVVVALTSTIWVTTIVFHLLNVIQLVRFEWVSTQGGCVPVENDPNSFDFMPAIIADMCLLLIILAGLFTLRRNGVGVFGLTRIIWKQGIIWLILASAAEVLSLVFTLLNKNAVADRWARSCIEHQIRYTTETLGFLFLPTPQLFDTPSQIIMLIAATRMHRSLVNFASNPSNDVYEIPLVSNITFPKTKLTDPPPTALDWVEVAGAHGLRKASDRPDER